MPCSKSSVGFLGLSCKTCCPAVSSACAGDFFHFEEDYCCWEWDWKTLMKKGELESRILVLLAHQNSPLCVY